MNTNTKENSFEIIDGPSRSDLFASCERSYDQNSNINIEFTIVYGYTMPKDHPGCANILMKATDFRIAGIEHEDGSGHSFNLRGYCRANLEPYVGADLLSPHQFMAYFNAKTRKGTITFFK